MRALYVIARFYPVLALSLCLALYELGMFFRRRKDRKQFYFWGAVVVLVLTTGLWVGFRGDINSDKWVRALAGASY